MFVTTRLHPYNPSYSILKPKGGEDMPQSQEVSRPLSKMKPQKYEDPRPKEYFDRFHRWARTHGPRFFIHGLVRFLVWLIVVPTFRVRVIGLENVPTSGPIILAPNHNSFLDHFFAGVYVPRHMRFWAKSNMYRPAAAGWFFTLGGTFCGRRGAKPRDEEAFITAQTLLRQGWGVTMYCEGGRSRTGKVADEAKSGIAYLADSTGATVVPVAIHGSERCRNWKKLEFPKITVEFGKPMHFTQDAMNGNQKEVANLILGEVRYIKEHIVRPPGWCREWLKQGATLLVDLPVRTYYNYRGVAV
jgi:1-acyl-sn-glycerol-3-phosphate acyltransferase